MLPSPPSTSNTRSSHDRASFIYSPKEFIKALSDLPCMLDGDIPPLPELTRTITDTGFAWPPTPPSSPQALPPPTPIDGSDSTRSLINPVSTRPSIISNTPSTGSSSFTPRVPSNPTWRPTKLERLLRKLVPCKPRTSTPTPKRSPRGRTGSATRLLHNQMTSCPSHPRSATTGAYSHPVPVYSPYRPKTRHKCVKRLLSSVLPILAHLASSTSTSTSLGDE
ncbi:hypothetical protein OG21DRAFT_1144463 [Imleria badia]|nr:hypothetical protein OG21DRAFT_1144463 [Imleria badia]